MPTMSLRHDHEVIYEWLREQAERLGLHVVLLTSDARLKSEWLYLPVYVEDAADAYDNALKLQQLEDTWNDREPRPEPPLFLIPAKNPVRQVAWERMEGALQRKLRAVEAFSDAANEKEREEALAEFQNARRVEEEAHRDFERIRPHSNGNNSNNSKN